MERKEYLVEITYSDSGNNEVETIKTDDLAWSMNQYQRNRLPLTWEIVDKKDCCGDGCCDVRPELDGATLEDLEMIHQGIVNNESDNS